MLHKRPCLLLQRKVLLTLAAAILLACAINRPWRLLLVFSSKGLTSIVVLVIAGLLVAVLVHELAQVCFRSRSGPWYTRRGATVFVLVLLIGVNLLLPVADHLVLKVGGVGPFLSSAATAYALIAAELIWIALLE